MLPLWVSKLHPEDAWYEKDIYNNTSDGGDAYTHDPDFLKSFLQCNHYWLSNNYYMFQRYKRRQCCRHHHMGY